jgi:hypothetical protein
MWGYFSSGSGHAMLSTEGRGFLLHHIAEALRAVERETLEAVLEGLQIAALWGRNDRRKI